MSHHNHHHHHHHEERYEEAPYGYAPPPPAYGYGQESGYEIQPSYGYPPAVPNVGQSSYGNGGYGTYENSPYQDGYGAPAIYQEEQRVQQYEYLQREEHKHKNREHTAEMGVLAAGAFAMYEKHEEKVDPAHARQHKVEAEVARQQHLGSEDMPSMSITSRTSTVKLKKSTMARKVVITKNTLGSEGFDRLLAVFRPFCGYMHDKRHLLRHGIVHDAQDR